MNRYLIKDEFGEAQNIIVADEHFVEERHPGRYERISDAESTTPEKATPRHISVGAFFDRFGADKLPLLASADPMVQAFIKDATVRKYIDLDRADLRSAVATLGMSQSIIDSPVQDFERP